MLCKVSLFCLFISFFYSIEVKSFWFKVPKKSEAIVTLGSTPDHAFDPHQIKVLVWNLYKGKKTTWKEDLLFFQENND